MQSFGNKDNPCKSFAPNIFNKNKCQNCFRPRETHLQSDKDLNKAKPVYAGWLLLAPIGTDFNNPTQKNRKWQRRWFVLFEHGALRYALDDNITTVAQGTIDMNRSTDVLYAETTTDQKYSLCISLPDQSYFIRGENKEDIMGWHDQLVVYPETIKEEMRLKNRLFKKRKNDVPQNAPVISSRLAYLRPYMERTLLLWLMKPWKYVSWFEASYSAPNTPLAKPKKIQNSASHTPKSERSKPPLGSPLLSRSRNNSSSSVKSPTSEKGGFMSPRHPSTRKDAADLILSSSSSDKSSGSSDQFTSKNLRSGGKVLPGDVNQQGSKLDTSYFTVDRNLTELSKDKSDSVVLPSAHLQRNISVSTSSLDSSASNHSFADSTDGSQSQPGSKKKHFKDYHNLADVPKAKRISNRHYKEQRKEIEKKTRARSPGRDEVDRMFGRERRRSRVIEAFEVMQADPSNKENNEPNVTSDGSHGDHSSSSTVGMTSSPMTSPRDGEEKRGRSISRRSTNKKQGTQTEQSKSNSALRRTKSLDRNSYENIQLSADLFNVKKGWLTMQHDGGSWIKHWFVLGKNVLKFYQDSTSEDSSAADGLIDLHDLVKVRECDVQRNYGFEVETIEKTATLAAMTSGIRRNWMNAILKSTSSDVTVEDGTKQNPAERKPEDKIVIKIPAKKSGLDDLSVTERSQRRRARIRDRRREGRSRTFDFAEFRPLATQALGADPVADVKQESSIKTEGKARSRTFDPDALLKDLKNSKKEEQTTKMDARKPVFKPALIQRSLSDLRVSIESEWKKVEKVNYKTLNGDLPLSPNPITETASMVEALQNEVDSLKKQMERVQVERSSSSEECQSLMDSGLGSLKPADEGFQNKIKQQNKQIDKLKQELSIAQEALRKQSSELRECGMQLDISLSESQLVETQLANSQGELQLEKSRREEEGKEHLRKLVTLNKELEDSDSQLKKTETLHLVAQRRIRELERQVNMQKDHNKEEALLQEHIGMLRHHAEEQEVEMREMQEAFEARCQNQMKLEERLSETSEVIKTYEEQIHEMKEVLKNTDKDITIISAHRNDAQLDIEKLKTEVEASRLNEDKLKKEIARLFVQTQIDEECNKSLQNDLEKEKQTSQRLQAMLKEHDDDFNANEKQLASSMDQLSHRLKAAEESKTSLKKNYKDLNIENKKLKEEIAKSHQSESTVRDLRARLSTAEKELGDIEEIRSRSTPTESSFKALKSELEAEMGGTSDMIAARLTALEPSRRVSDPFLSSDKASFNHKIHRLELEMEKKNKELKLSEDKLKEFEERENEAEDEFTEKLQELKTKQEIASKDFEKTIAGLKVDLKEDEECLQATQDCLRELHNRVSQIVDANNSAYAAELLQSVMCETLKLSQGDTDLEPAPRSPSPSSTLGDKKWSRITDAETRQQHQKKMSRFKQLTEQLKNADGRLVSPSASPVSFIGQPESPSTSGRSKKLPQTRPADLLLPTMPLTEEGNAQLFAKQISTQALLLAEMAATLRRSQSSPALTTVGRSQTNYNHNNRQAANSPQVTSAEFSDTIAHHTTTGGLLQHVDTLAQKLTLAGMLMREMSRMKESWTTSNRRNLAHRGIVPGLQPNSELSSAMVAHAHISYVLQVYNERISRLSLEARQARHRADAAMRKLRELVHACKTQDLEAVSNLAVQVDTDSIAPPYSDIPPWEQQVDYGTLHGAQSMTSQPTTEATHLDQEATFFQHLADDLKCMSADVQSLSKIGSQLVQADNELQKYLQPSEIGEHASTVAREAIVQAEIIYISHRLRRDYDEELRKAKNAVFEQSRHFEALKIKVKQSEENWSGKLKQVTDEHNAKVGRLMQEAGRLERARVDMSKDVEERLTRLSRKHEQEMATCNAKHEQEFSSLRKELSNANVQLETKSKEYLNEVKRLKGQLNEIKIQHRKESSETREDYDRKYEKAKAECLRDVEKLKSGHESEVKQLKNEFMKEMNEVEKEFSDKLTSIEAAKKEEVESLKKKNRISVKTLEADHKDSMIEVEQDFKVKTESLKRDFDDLLQQEKSKHQMELKNIQDDAESLMREQVRQKLNELKKEQEKVLENRDKLHKEQLEREKEIWMKELRAKWDKEQEASHVRSNSITSDGDTRDGLKARITLLEGELSSMQGQLEDEQHRHDYRKQLEEIKKLCDESFQAIEESHAKQLEDITTAHKRELEKLSEEHWAELKTNKKDMKHAIEAIRKHHSEELRSLRYELRDEASSDRNDPLRRDVDKLKKEIETLSEHYSRKCVELANALEQNEKTADALRLLERDNRRLRARKNAIDGQKIETEVKKLKNSSNEDKFSGDLYQLEVMLRVKASEIEYLKQEVTSLNQQMDENYQDKKQSQKMHQDLFDDLTLSRSKEGMARREVGRLKEQLRHHGIHSDDDDVEGADSSADKGYDFQKSRSQPHFPTSPANKPTSSTTSQMTSVKRRSSDRTNKYGKI